MSAIVIAAVFLVIGLALAWSAYLQGKAQESCDRMNAREKEMQAEWKRKFTDWKWGCGEDPGPPPPCGPHWYVG